MNSSTSSLSINDWIGVLRLSQMWAFNDERQKAINALDEHLDDGKLIRKFAIAREFDVKEWLRPIYEELTTQTTAIMPEALHGIPCLHHNFFYDLSRAREAHYKAILYRILTSILKVKCFCRGSLKIDEDIVRKGPEWFFSCSRCVRVFTLEDAVRMSSLLQQTTADKMKDDVAEIVNNILLRYH